MLFLLNHLHWLILVAVVIIIGTPMTIKKKGVLLFLCVLLLAFNRTSIFQFKETKAHPKPVSVTLKTPEIKDINLKPNLSTQEREERIKELLNFQKSFDEILKE